MKRGLRQYKQRYLEMYGNNPAPTQPRQTGKSAMRKVGVLLRELSDDKDETSPSATPTPMGDPWLPGFNNYWKSSDHLGDISIVEWWSVDLVKLLVLLKVNTLPPAEYYSTPCLVISCARLPSNHGIISF